MTASLMPMPKQAFYAVDNSGRYRPLVDGKVYTYITGTTTPKATYTTAAGTTANANPVILDARGEASVWLGTGAYRIVLKDSSDSEIWTQDGVTGSAVFTEFHTTATDLSASAGVTDGQIAVTLGYNTVGDGGGNMFRWSASSTSTSNGGTIIAATGITTGRWLALDTDRLNVLQFGARRDGDTDYAAANTTAIQAALTAQFTLQQSGSGTGGGRGAVPVVYFPNGVYSTSSTLYLKTAYAEIEGDQAMIVPTHTSGPVLSSNTGGPYGWRVRISGMQFQDGETLVYLDSNNVNSGRVVFDYCSFFNSTSKAIHIDCQSSAIAINDCIFRSNARELYIEEGDAVTMTGGWISRGLLAADGSQGTAGIYNNGYLRMIDVLCVPTTQTLAEAAWVDNYKEFWATRVRFGGESGSHAAVNNYAAADIVNPINPTHVTLDSCNCYNTADDNATIRLFELPNAIRLINCNGFPDQNYIRWSTTVDAGEQATIIADLGAFVYARDHFRIDVSGNTIGYDPPSLASEPMVPANLQEFTRIRMPYGALIAAGGKLGIGTTAPGAEIDIRSADGLTSRLRLANDGDTILVGDQLGRLEFFSGDNSGATADTVVAGIVGRQAATTPSAGYVAMQADDGTDKLEVWGTLTRPTVDNTMALGDATHRFTTVYATTGAINTSDRNQKHGIRALSDAEKALGAALRGLVQVFAHNGRESLSVGVIAQDVIAAFDAAGLNWRDYDIVTESDGVYGVRYDGLMALIIGGLV